MTLLPPRIARQPKRSSRWRSPAHRKHVASFACAMCHSKTNVVAAHLRMGSGAGLGTKPDDWLTAPLCESVVGGIGCHNVQHMVGERTFWLEYEQRHGQTVYQLIEALIASSPKRFEIERVRKERGE